MNKRTPKAPAKRRSAIVPAAVFAVSVAVGAAVVPSGCGSNKPTLSVAAAFDMPVFSVAAAFDMPVFSVAASFDMGVAVDAFSNEDGA